MAWWESALIIIGIALLVFVALKLLKVSFKVLWKLLINALVGGVVLWLLNLIPGVDMPINWLTTIAGGFSGVPAFFIFFLVIFFGKMGGRMAGRTRRGIAAAAALFNFACEGCHS